MLRRGLLDISSNTLTYLSNATKVYDSQGGKGVVVDIIEEWEVPCEMSEWVSRGRVIFTAMAIKDVYMLFFLHLNEDFDDDLLCDAMSLITE